VTAKTESEALFEAFCATNRLDWAPYGTKDTPTPDYRLGFAGATVCVEIKQIESEVDFVARGRQSRTVGEHVRRKITEAKAQLFQARAAQPRLSAETSRLEAERKRQTSSWYRGVPLRWTRIKRSV
jgi:hypothetical protein